MPPVERLQVALPSAVDVLGWVNAEKNGSPTLVPEPEEEVAAPAAADAPGVPAVEAAQAAEDTDGGGHASTSSSSSKNASGSFKRLNANSLWPSTRSRRQNHGQLNDV